MHATPLNAERVQVIWTLSDRSLPRENTAALTMSQRQFLLSTAALTWDTRSAYFLSRFPRCDVVAIEPDPQNFELLRLNLSPYGKRARALRAAVWSHETKLTLSEERYRDGREWSRQFRECRPGEDSDLLTVNIGSILDESAHERISVLKVDIEGAEAVVFSKNYESWIDRVDNMVVEIHDAPSFGDCAGVFGKAVAGRGFSITQFEELTVCKRLV